MCIKGRAAPWVYGLKKAKRPVRAKALIINAFALAGRIGICDTFTQGGALPFIHIFDNSQHLTFAEEIVKSCFESCISWT